MATFWVDGDRTLCAEFDLEDDPMTVAIQKWEFIRDHPEVEHTGGRETCGLCRVVDAMEYGTCFDCPVTDYARMDSCLGTPFEDWLNASERNDAEAKRDFAQQEINFLNEIQRKMLEGV